MADRSWIRWLCAAGAVAALAIVVFVATRPRDERQARGLVRRQRSEPADVIVALNAAERSWRMQPTADGARNRARLLETVNLKAAAARAWEEYLASDPPEAPADEARSHLAALAAPPAADPKQARMVGEEQLLPAWAEAVLAGDRGKAETELRRAAETGEALRRSGEQLLADTVAQVRNGDEQALAEAVRTYREGRAAYLRRDFTAAEPLLQQAEEQLRKAGSPLAALADVYHAGALHWSNRYGDVIPSLDRKDDPCAAGRRYRAACGLRKWISGLAMVQTGRPGDSLAEYDTAIASFRTIGERENAAAVLGLRAETLDYMTAFDEGWADRLEALAIFASPIGARPTLWKSVAAAAVRDHYEYAADVILSELAADARRRKDALYVAEALMWQALARSRISETFTPDVGELQRTLAAIPDPAVRARTQANLGMVLAEIAANRTGALDADLAQALAFYRQSSDRFNTMLAFAARRSGSDAELTEAVREFERQAADVDDPFLRVLFSDRERQLFLDACRAKAARGRDAEALWFSDAARLAALPAQARKQNPRDLVAAMPAGVTIVQQELFEKQLLTWIIRNRTVSLTAASVDASQVTGDMDRLLQAVHRSEETRLVARRLYDTLLRDADRTAGSDLLIYSPPEKLRRLPVGLLHDGSTLLAAKRPLATTRTIGMLSWKTPAPEIAAVLLVAPEEDDGAERLSGIRRELAALQNIYGARAEELRGSAVTPVSFLQKAATVDLIHVGAHGSVDRRPLHNALAFGAERLRAFDVLSTRLPRAPVVVLAACRTSDDTEGRSSVSLTTAFVAAGASAVVGTLWDVEDEGTAELLSDFHRSLARGMKACDALRAAQLEAMRKGRSAELWAAFQIQM